MPLAGRIESGCFPSSRARTSSAHTPVAFTTDAAWIAIEFPLASTVAPVTRPVSPLVRPVSRQPLAITASNSGAAAGGVGSGGCDREGEARIVVLGVVVEVRAGEPVGRQRRHVLERPLLAQPLMDLADPGSAGDVVHPHRAAHGAGDLGIDEPVLREDRDEER